MICVSLPLLQASCCSRLCLYSTSTRKASYVACIPGGLLCVVRRREDCACAWSPISAISLNSAKIYLLCDLLCLLCV